MTSDKGINMTENRKTYRCTGQSEDGSGPDAEPCATHQDMTETVAISHLLATGHEYEATHPQHQPQLHRIVAECWTCTRQQSGGPNLKSTVYLAVGREAFEYHRAAGHDVRPVRSEDSHDQD